jgi:cyclin T
VHYPYKPLTETIKKFKITNDGYANATLALFSNTSTQFMSVLHAKKVVHYMILTSLCLQFKPQHIAGALFLVGRFLKVMFLPDYGEKASYQEFGGTPRQLEGWFLDVKVINSKFPASLVDVCLAFSLSSPFE